MQKITTVTDLRIAIQQLEYKQANEWTKLREQSFNTYESLKPLAIISNTIKGIISTPDLKTNIINSAIGFSTGFVAKKLFDGSTHNPLTKLLGFFLEMAVANNVIKNADEIKSLGSSILKKLITRNNDSRKE